MKDISTDLLLESIPSNLFPIKLFDDKVFLYSSQRTTIVAIALAFIFHILFYLILSDYINDANQKSPLVSETSKGLTVTLSLKNTKNIIPHSIDSEFNENKSTTKKLSTNKATTTNSIENIIHRKREAHSDAPSESVSKEKDQPFILQDILDNVADYMEKAKPKPVFNGSIIMDNKLRKAILMQRKHDKSIANIKSQQIFRQDNQYFEFKSEGAFSTVRIKGKCFMIPADVAFSNEPKVWMSAGSCEKKIKLNFNPAISW